MPDREKVVKGLIEVEKFISNGKITICEPKAWSGNIHMIEAAIDLLKEREAVVHPEPSCEMTYITNCCCDLCGVQLIREDNFCRCCGKRIEWEGR